jgi:hypothetical protein
MPAATYVMHVEGRDHFVRVGHYSTSASKRLRQVGDQGEAWAIAASEECLTKATACAVEMLTQALLQEHGAIRPVASGRRTLIYSCSTDEAVRALRYAKASVDTALDAFLEHRRFPR